MLKKIVLSLISIALVVMLSACGTMGSFRSNHLTVVELSQPNFNIVARGVQGSAMQGYLLGISGPQVNDIFCFGLIKVAGVDKPYDAALNNLWENYREQYGETEGKKLALINVRQDNETLNTIVYTEAKYYITADVIEFTE